MPQPLWDVLVRHKPQVFAWLGDIVYTDNMILPGVWVCFAVGGQLYIAFNRGILTTNVTVGTQ